VRSHAKASSAGSTQRQASGLGRFFRGTFATRSSSRGASGSGAPSFRPNGLSLVSLFATFVTILAVFAATASATLTHNPESFSPLTGASSGVTLDDLSAIALDEATGNTFISKGGSGEEVLILGGEGGAPIGLTPPFAITGLPFGSNAPAGVAFDNSASSPNRGTLYAYNGDTETINKYTRDAGTEKYELSGEIPVPGAGFYSGLGVDAAGNVYLGALFGAASVYKFSSAGSVLDEYDLSETPASVTGQIAVDSVGDVFVQAQNGSVYKFPADGSGNIDPSVFSLFVPGTTGGVAYDPATNHIYASVTNVGVAEYDATTGSKISEFGAEALPGRTERLAVDSSTERIYVVNYSDSNVVVFGPPVLVPTTQVSAATNVTGTKATLNGSVNPEGFEVVDCFFEYGLTTSYGQKTTSCEGPIPTDSETHTVSAKVSGLTPNGTTYHYRLVAKGENGTERSGDKTLVTGGTVITEAPTGVGKSIATLHGVVRPEGLPFSACRFEYKLTTDVAFKEGACEPPAGSIEADFSEHAVALLASELRANSTYEFRLSATNSEGIATGKVLTFSTPGPPQIGEIRALDAAQGTVTIEGKINPSGFGTSYRIEWGPTTSYGHQVPAEFEPFVGSGTEAVRVSAKLTGLSAATTYHYRIVASSSAGITASPDQTGETLNSCGLPEGRCFELVSRRDAGPVGIPGEHIVVIEMHYQAKTSGPGLAYSAEAGYPEATHGAEVLYRGVRGPDEWESAQITPPLSGPNQTGDDSSNGPVEWLSNDLSCGFLWSNRLLTSDPGTRLVGEYGSNNLYRLNPDGSHTAVTSLTPENPEGGGGKIGFGSQDCGKVVFTSGYRYPGVPAAADPFGTRFYEWDEGTLRSVGMVPGPGGGEVPVASKPGSSAAGGDQQNVVSEDGSRVFFAADRQTSANPAEIGREGIFVRENGSVTRDLSLSETGIPDKGATYQWATPDGSAVYFLANAGLTAESNSEGTDLYKYDLETEKLTDVSVDGRSGKAEARGFIAAAADGSRVYFAARGQLVAGRGNTLAQNKAEETFSIYSESDGEYSYVGQVEDGLQLRRTVVEFQSEWSSEATADGRYMIFESGQDITGYESGNRPEVFLYDAEKGSEGTICVSCRQDGQPSVTPPGNNPNRFEIRYTLLPTDQPINNALHPPHYLAERDGKPLVLFTSPDPLAPGAVVEQNNVYEWSHGQVFRLTSSQEGQQSPWPYGGQFAAPAGLSDDGSDFYFSTPETLNWEDGDQRLSVYDARIGGGYTQPPTPLAPCVPTSEGSCQGPAQGGAVVPGAASATFNGPGNPTQTQPQKKAHKKKSKKHAKKKKGSGKKARHANGNRRAGK
jgi:hypothetical protein